MPFLRFTFGLTLLCGLLLSGCTGYQLGSQLPADIQSVYVPTVSNQTNEPLLENEVTKAVLSQIQRDGSLRIANEEEADAVLYVTLTSYRIDALAFDRANRARPNEYRLILEARVEMVRRSNGKVLARNGLLQGRNDFPLTGDLTSAKQNGLPAAAEDLARFVVATITEAWTE